MHRLLFLFLAMAVRGVLNELRQVLLAGLLLGLLNLIEQDFAWAEL